MPASTPGPRPRSYRRDTIDSEGLWTDPTEQHEISTTDVIAALPDAGHLVPASRHAADEGIDSTIVRATWKARAVGSDLEVRGSLAAVLEFRPGRDQR